MRLGWRQYEEWDAVAKQAADQDVINSTTLVNSTNLSFAVLLGEVWRFEYDIIYSGNSAACDFKCDFAPTAGNMTGHYCFVGSDTIADVINVSTGIRLAAAATIAVIPCGTPAAFTTKRTLQIEAMIQFSANATVNFRFAQNTLTATFAARLNAGSRVRGKKLS